MLFDLRIFIRILNDLWLWFKLQTQIIVIIVIGFIFILGSDVTYGNMNKINTLQSFYNEQTKNSLATVLQNNNIIFKEETKLETIISCCEQMYRQDKNIFSLWYIDPNKQTYAIPYYYTSIFPRLRPTKIANYSQGLNLNFKFYKRVYSNVVTIKFSESYHTFVIYKEFNSRWVTTFLINKRPLFFFLSLGVPVLLFSFVLIKKNDNGPLTMVINGLINLAAGNFSTRIHLQNNEELDELINNFNELGHRLQLYEEKNYEQLRSENLKLESLIATITDGILLLDTDLKIILLNRKTTEIFEWKNKKSIIDTPIWDNLPTTLQKNFFIALQRVLREQKEQTKIELTVKNESNPFSRKRVRITLKIIYNSPIKDSRVPIGIGLVIQDRTKEVELDNSQTRFIGNISHELRTPVFNIKSFIETIQEYDYTLSTAQKQHFIHIVSVETNRLTRLLNSVLCMSRLHSRKHIILRALRITGLVNQTLATYQLVVLNKNIYLHSTNRIINAQVLGNRDLLLQVLMNLVENALKFTYQDGEIIIRVYLLTSKKIRIEVIDTGIGINNNYQAYIFQRFYRIENEIHTLRGTGLGLYIIKSILLEHNSQIRVISRYRVGSLFWFDLDAAV